MRTIVFAVVFVGLAHAACVEVSSDRILARDLRDAWPPLQGVDPDTVLSFAPRPGVQRILSATELILFARKHGLDPTGAGIAGICVERAVRPISGEEMSAALLSAVGGTDVELELVEFSREPLPPGQLDFRTTNLARSAGENLEVPLIWRGFLRFDRQNSAAVWAKVKVSVGGVRLVAAKDIPANTVIEAAHVKEVHGRHSPFLPVSLTSPEEIIGKIARRNIPAGQNFIAGALQEPVEISPCDTVHVMVVDGSATLSLDTVAQSSGKKGERIWVHNPSTGKNFRAVVEEKGKAAVRSTPGP